MDFFSRGKMKKPSSGKNCEAHALGIEEAAIVLADGGAELARLRLRFQVFKWLLIAGFLGFLLLSGFTLWNVLVLLRSFRGEDAHALDSEIVVLEGSGAILVRRPNVSLELARGSGRLIIVPDLEEWRRSLLANVMRFQKLQNEQLVARNVNSLLERMPGILKSFVPHNRTNQTLADDLNQFAEFGNLLVGGQAARRQPKNFTVTAREQYRRGSKPARRARSLVADAPGPGGDGGALELTGCDVGVILVLVWEDEEKTELPLEFSVLGDGDEVVEVVCSKAWDDARIRVTCTHEGSTYVCVEDD